MTDITQNTQAGSQVQISDEVREKYPDIVEMIFKSISMDDDERKYWFSVLPVMSESQIAELRDILTSEQKKIKEIDEKYSQEEDNKEPELSVEDLQKAEEERQKRRQQRLQEEAEHREEEETEADNLLGELDNL